MREDKFKTQLTIAFFGGKLLVILAIIFFWKMNGFTTKEMLGATATVLPMFTVYTAIMFKPFAKNRYVNSSTKDNVKTLKKSYVYITWFFMFIYVISIVYVIYLKAASSFSYASLQTSFGLIESAIGIYLGIIIKELFKEKKENQ